MYTHTQRYMSFVKFLLQDQDMEGTGILYGNDRENSEAN